MRNLLLFVFLFAGQTSADLAAQVDSTYQIEEIVVMDNRIQIPFSEHSRTLNIITRSQIELMPARSIPELLQTVAGIDIRQRGVHGVQADVSIRGGTFDQTLILINGVKMSDPQTGHHALNIPIDMESIERIEILKGPAARIYGQNAFAGAINIVTRVPEERYARVGGTIGQNDLYGINASIALPKSNFKQYASFSKQLSDGYRYNTDYDITNLFYQTSFKYLNQELDLMASLVDRKFGANRFYGNDADFFADQYEEVQTSLVSLGYKNIIGDFALRPRISWRRNVDEYLLIRDDPAFYRNKHTSNVFTFEVNGDYYSDLGITGIGVELMTLNLESNNLGARDRQVGTFFLEHRFDFLDSRLDITPGISASYYSDFGGRLFPGVDIGYTFNERVKTYANTGYTWRIPTYTDLYYEDAANLGNADLDPESAISYEVGFKYLHQGVEFQASYFVRDGRELIDWTRATADDRWQPQNISDVMMSGLDFSLNLRLAEITGQPIVQNLRLAYTYIDAEEPQNDVALSRYVLENLQHQLIGGLDLQLASPLFLSANYRYLDRVTLEDYHLLDVRLSYRTKQWELFLQADNLLDTEYRESNLVDMPGRWVTGGVSWRFGL